MDNEDDEHDKDLDNDDDKESALDCTLEQFSLESGVK